MNLSMTKVHQFMQTLETFQSATEDAETTDVTIRQIMVYLLVAMEEGQHTIVEVGERLELGKVQVSRAIRRLSQWERPNKPGLNLVETRPHPADFRKRLCYLTEKGRELMLKMRYLK